MKYLLLLCLFAGCTGYIDDVKDSVSNTCKIDTSSVRFIGALGARSDTATQSSVELYFPKECETFSTYCDSDTLTVTCKDHFELWSVTSKGSEQVAEVDVTDHGTHSFNKLLLQPVVAGQKQDLKISNACTPTPITMAYGTFKSNLPENQYHVTYTYGPDANGVMAATLSDLQFNDTKAQALMRPRSTAWWAPTLDFDVYWVWNGQGWQGWYSSTCSCSTGHCVGRNFDGKPLQ